MFVFALIIHMKSRAAAAARLLRAEIDLAFAGERYHNEHFIMHN